MLGAYQLRSAAVNFSKLFGITILAAFATTEAHAAFFSSDNFLAPVKGASRATSGWVIDPSAVGTTFGSNGAPVAAGQVGEVVQAFKLSVGETSSAGQHRDGGFFRDSYSLTLADDAMVSIDLQDKQHGLLFNIDKLNLAMTDSAGNLVAQAGEGESFVTSMLDAGNYSISISGVSQAVKGGVYSAQFKSVQAPLPAAAWLFCSALAALFGVKRWRNRAGAQ